MPNGGGCISNTLINGCVAHYNTKVNVFFNQKQELVKFTNAFSANLKLHVVLGLPSTEKTALVCEITSKDNFNPLFINCRKEQFDISEKIYDLIYSQFSPFFDKYKDFLEKVVGKQFSVGYASFNVKYKFGESRATTSNDIIRMLDNISIYLSN